MRDEQLADGLRQIAEGLLRIAEAFEPEPVAPPAPKPVVEAPPKKLIPLRGEALRRAFRDWVVEQRGEFSKAEVIADMDVAPDTAGRLIRWAEGRKPPIIEDAGTRPARRDGPKAGGRPAKLYAYVRPDPSKNPKRRPRGERNGRGALREPVKGTGKQRGPDKEVQKLRQKLHAQGWTTEQVSGGHIKVTDPTGKVLPPFAATPGDRRSLKNAKSALRRAGAKL